MSDQRVGAAIRAVRVRRRWRQRDVADRARVSASLVSLIERGHMGGTGLDTLRRVAAVLDVRIDIVVRWRGGELDRLVSSRHAALQGAVAERLTLHGWTVVPEASFAYYGERGSIDLLAWHAATRTLMVVEVKTEIVDAPELIGTMDRKTRLAPRIARDRGWSPLTVSSWLVVADSTANRDRVARFGSLLRAAFPNGAHEMRAWLRSPTGRIAGLSFLRNSTGSGATREFAARKRVRVERRP